jgi:hypothetical protein
MTKDRATLDSPLIKSAMKNIRMVLAVAPSNLLVANALTFFSLFRAHQLGLCKNLCKSEVISARPSDTEQNSRIGAV